MNNFLFKQSFQNLENITYNHQPHLGPYMWALFLDNSFIKYEYIGRLYYVFIFVTAIFSLKLNKNINQSFEAAIILSLIVLLTYDFYLFGGYQEYLIFSLILFAGNFLYKISTYNKISIYHLLLFSIILNLILWSKQEGLAYIFILQIVFIYNQISNYQKIISIFLFFLVVLFKINFSFNNLLDDPHFSFTEIINFDYKLIVYKIFLFLNI